MTTLQVWDTNNDTVDKETIATNRLIPHIVHNTPIHIIICEQFIDNVLMALLTRQQQAVLAILKEDW